MIDAQTGNIYIVDTVTVKAGDLLEKIKALQMGLQHYVHDMGTGWIWLREENIFVNGLYCTMSLGFFQQKLEMVSLVVGEDQFKTPLNWDGYSEAKEIEKWRHYSGWLEKELGRACDRTDNSDTVWNYAWGKIGAGFDTRGGAASIYVVYNRCS